MGNVVSMADFLVKKYHKVAEEWHRINDLATNLSNQKKDMFAAPLIKKAKGLQEQTEAIKKHIQFIISGGRGQVIPMNKVYNFVPNSPPISINYTIPTPTK